MARVKQSNLASGNAWNGTHAHTTQPQPPTQFKMAGVCKKYIFI